jgi:hypothetical protein
MTFLSFEIPRPFTLITFGGEGLGESSSFFFAKFEILILSLRKSSDPIEIMLSGYLDFDLVSAIFLFNLSNRFFCIDFCAF